MKLNEDLIKGTMILMELNNNAIIEKEKEKDKKEKIIVTSDMHAKTEEMSRKIDQIHKMFFGNDPEFINKFVFPHGIRIY
jgi:hypothetical protein